ncbi:MAG: hypothetical protein WBP93_21070, partial [Pyrinomonadaceae bacterium]
MSFEIEKLYALLPAVHRLRDAEQGEPLKAFLSVIAEQIAVLEEDMEQLYEDQFIETCAEWVVPYIGDLVGTRGVFTWPGAKFSERAQVANTLAYRRRKGTAAVLEQLAHDVTDWDASVVEYFQLLATTQYMNHIRLQNLASPDMSRWEPLERVGTPFDSLAHTADVRHIASRRGKYNIPNVGIFLWRIKSNPLTDAPAYKLDEHRYLFNPLGLDTPLYNKTETEEEITHLAGPTNVPMPLSRRVLKEYLETYYGIDETDVVQGSGERGTLRSILINVDGEDIDADETSPPDSSPPPATLSSLIRVCDLRDLTDGSGDWAHMPDKKIAIDPVLGRIAFPTSKAGPKNSVRTSFYYGFSAEMGGGEYGRADTFDDKLTPVVHVPKDHPTIIGALTSLTAGGAVEVSSNDYFVETPQISVPAGRKVELRAGDERRPIILLESAMGITGGEESVVTLNGLVIYSGGTIHVSKVNDDNETNKLRLLRLEHCTLLPPNSVPQIKNIALPVEIPRLYIEAPNVTVEIDRCIVGPISAIDGARVRITNSIIDAGAETSVAYAGPETAESVDYYYGKEAGAPLEIENCTVRGRVHARTLEASNTIFFSEPDKTTEEWTTPVRAERLQEGCVRFSYVPPGSEVPRQYECQPVPGDSQS